MPKKPKKYGNFIGGKWIKPKKEEYFPTHNPAKPNEILGYFPKSSQEDVKHAIDVAEKAYEKWRDVPAPKRGEILLRIAQILRKRKDELGKLVTREMGKVLPEGLGDVQEAIDMTEYMAGEGRRLFGHTTTSELRNKFAMTVRMPIGVCGLITPWNFPIAIPSWKIIPALICGNTMVLKPSSDTPLCAATFIEVLHDAGVPPGVVNMVTGSGEVVGNALVTNKKVHGVSFTGSKATGEKIVKKAGVKKVGLELGGKNPILVMQDADLNLVLEGVIWGAFGTTGQRCTAASRVIVHKAVKKKLEKMLVARTKRLCLGDGLKPSTDVGPLINEHAVKKSEMYCDLGKEEGAKLMLGGKRPQKPGHFFQPTIFTDVEPDARIAQDEIFGPVLSIIEAKNLDEAIDICNSVEYGLSSSIYTNDVSVAFQAIQKIEAGLTYINSSTIGSEVHLPFGGVKGTGAGTREGGWTALDEFSEIKTVYVDFSGKLQRAQIDIED